jgi:predicted dehydrogenase
MPDTTTVHAAQLLEAVRQARPPQPDTVRPIIVLGSGEIVRAAHLPAYAKARFPVIALADRDPERSAGLASDFGIANAFDDPSDALKSAPEDAVFDVAVPASELPSILATLPKKAVVLMQKPTGDTVEEARTILNICRERELIAAVNFQLRYAPNHLGALALAQWQRESPGVSAAATILERT